MMGRTGWAKLLALCMLLLMSLVSPAWAGGGALNPRLAPALRRLLYETSLPSQNLARGEERRPDQATVTNRVTLTVRAEHDVSSQIAALGGRVNTVVGEHPAILTVRLSTDRLGRLARIPGIISVSASEPLSTALDKSTVDIGADEVWNLHSGGVSITGQDVLIGIVDTGIDLTHPDFKDQSGQSRILAIWDQTVSGSSPSGFDYGTEWRRWQIDAGLARETDTDGHGTHVAGVAAGSGTHYTGVAPGSELIVVKSLLDTASIIDAWNYIVEKARSRGQPVVINNSFGAHFGAHDGTADYERALDAVSGPGVILTAAAGNEGQTAMHASGQISTNGTATLPFSFFDGYGRSYADVNVWYDHLDSFAVSVTAPTGQTFGPVGKGDFQIFGAGDGTEITVDTVSAPWPANGDNWIRIRLDGPAGEGLVGDWSVELHGDRVVYGKFDAWLPYGPYNRAFFSYLIDSNVTIREPGTAIQAITASAYVTKECWTATNGQEYCDPYTEATIYPPSSRGPTRDSRPRPDVSAPGARVFATRSSDAPVDGPWQLAPDNRYAGHVGTSVSTAHLTGVIALMLQVDPTLTPATVREILQQTATQDEFTAAGSSHQWGAGKLDALGAVRRVQARTPHFHYLPLVVHNRTLQATPTATPTLRPTATRTPRPGPRPSPVLNQ